MADSDKTEKPTAKKKRDPRRKGQIAKSQDLTGWTSLLLGLYILPMTIGRIVSVPRGGFQVLRAASVEPDTATAVEQCKAGRVEFRMDRQGNVHVPIGKLSFSVDQLVGNARAAVEAIRAEKPAAVKAAFINHCTVSSSMGMGLRIDVRD